MSTLRVSINGREYLVQVTSRSGSAFGLQIGERHYEVAVQREVSPLPCTSHSHAAPSLPTKMSRSTKLAPGEVVAPMPGIVVSINAQVGQEVCAGHTLLVIEAMKMENPIIAPCSGIVKEVFVAPKTEVPQGHRLLLLQPKDE